MKKSVILLTTMAMSIAAVATLVAVSNYDSFAMKATERPSSISCDYYYNPANGFTSIHDIIQEVKNEENTIDKEYKTWGTVTCQWVESGKTCTYIQSRDANGNESGIQLYNINTSEEVYPIGSVVEISCIGPCVSLFQIFLKFHGKK